MGKTSVIRSLGKCIGTIALHKILLDHLNKPESEKHLADEVRDYSIDAFEKAQEFKWSDKDKSDIKEKALRRIKHIIKNYPDLTYEESRATDIINETMDDLLI